MGTNNASLVSAGKPKVGGAIFVAPKGTTLPTDTDSELNSAFANLGYVSDSGVVNSTSLEVNKVKAWGGDTVLITQTSKEDTYKYTLIEVKNVDVLKFIYGSENVTGDLESGLAIKANSKQLPDVSIVIDMILSDNTAMRVVIPSASISDVGDITYTDGDPIGYETTVDCTPDSDGNTHYEYLKKAMVSG